MLKTCQCAKMHTCQERPTARDRQSGSYHTQSECFGLDAMTGETCLWKAGNFRTPGPLDHLNKRQS